MNDLRAVELTRVPYVVRQGTKPDLNKVALIFDHSVEKFDELFIVLLLVPIITTNVLDL